MVREVKRSDSCSGETKVTESNLLSDFRPAQLASSSQRKKTRMLSAAADGLDRKQTAEICLLKGLSSGLVSVTVEACVSAPNKVLQILC